MGFLRLHYLSGKAERGPSESPALPSARDSFLLLVHLRAGGSPVPVLASGSEHGEPGEPRRRPDCRSARAWRGPAALHSRGLPRGRLTACGQLPVADIPEVGHCRVSLETWRVLRHCRPVCIGREPERASHSALSGRLTGVLNPGRPGPLCRAPPTCALPRSGLSISQRVGALPGKVMQESLTTNATCLLLCRAPSPGPSDR